LLVGVKEQESEGLHPGFLSGIIRPPNVSFQQRRDFYENKDRDALSGINANDFLLGAFAGDGLRQEKR
jgi:hypothetical protein